MNESRWERLGAASGLVFVVLLVIAFLVVPEPPDVDAPAQEVSRYYIDERDSIQIGLAIFSVATFFLLWFLGSVRSVLRAAEGGNGRLSAIAFGGGLVTVATIVMVIGFTAVAAFRPEETSPELTRALNDLGLLVFAPGALAAAAFFLATAAVALRTGALPAALGWLAALTGLAQVLSVGNIYEDSGAFAADGLLGFVVGFVLFLVWFLATSLVLIARSDASSSS